MNLNETIKVNSDLTFLRGQVMMILEQQVFLAKKQAEYEKQIQDLEEKLKMIVTTYDVFNEYFGTVGRYKSLEEAVNLQRNWVYTNGQYSNKLIMKCLN